MANRLEITNVDPLNAQYESVRVAAGHNRQGLYLTAAAEDLESHFGVASFDLVFSRNALDHTQDIRRALEGCLRMVGPSSVLYVELLENEALHAGYTGMHLWNALSMGGDVLLWNPSEKHSVSAIVNQTLGHDAWMQSRLVRSLGETHNDRQSSLHFWIVRSDPHECAENDDFLLSFHRQGGIKLTSKRYIECQDLMYLHIHYIDGSVGQSTFRWYPEAHVRYFECDITQPVFAVTVGETIPDFSCETTQFEDKWSLRIVAQ